MNRLASLTLVVLGLSACPPPPPPPPDAGLACPGSAGCVCLADSDCGNAGSLMACDLGTSQCFVTCRNDDDCNHHPSGALPQCQGELGCRCDDARCFAAQCSVDAECSTGACRNGACVEAPAATLTSCELVPALVVASVGEPVRFDVLLRDANGAVAQGPTASWTTSAPLSGSATGASAVFVVGPGGSTDQPASAVTVDVGGVTCAAMVLTVPAPAAGEVVVSVVDRQSRWPVSGAQVLVSDAAGQVLSTATTSTGGWARLPAAAGGAVSVFHPDFSYRTVIDAAGEGTVAIGLTRNRVDRTGGASMGFELPLTSNLHLGRLGLTGEPTALEVSDELEPTTPARVRIGSAIDQVTPLPVSTAMGFASSNFKGASAAGGATGCQAGGALDVSRVSTGACGTATAWALLGDVPLGDYPFEQIIAGRTLGLLDVLTKLEPKRAFSSVVVRDVSYGLGAAAMVDGGVDLSQLPGATALDAGLEERVVAGFHFLVKVPPLPTYDLQPLDRVVVAGLAQTPRGVVPLGFGAAPNTAPVDAAVDGSPGGPLGTVSVRMAPAHHGLEGSAYAALIQASSTARRIDAAAGYGESSRLVALDGGLTFEPRNHPVDPAGALLAVPEGGRLDVAARRFTLPAQAGAQVVQVTFADALDSRWDVLVSAAAPVFVLPAVPGALRDRLYAQGNQAARANVEVAALALDGGDFGAFVRSHRAPAPVSWAREVQRPLALRLGLTPGVELAASPPIPVAVEGFRVGTDGVVRVSVAGGIQCPDVTIDRVTDLGGTFAPRLAATCRGTDVTVTAELLDQAAAPLVPPVRASARVSIR